MKRKWNKGFTLLEVLIVVAIIAILAAVAAIAVDRQQKSMHHLEFDGMAREIYFAAQNHLTQAETQGLLDPLTTEEQLGTKIVDYKNNPEDTSEIAKQDVYRVAGTDTGTGKEILQLMLPKDALDILSTQGNGTFFIIYQKTTATVLDVFYASMDSRFGTNNTPFTEDDYNILKDLRDTETLSRKNQRRGVSDFNNAILGYYGGEKAQNERITLKAPELKVENGDRLKLIVTNHNTDASVLNYATLVVYITGVQSGNSESIPLLTTPDTTGLSAPTATTEGHISISDDYSTIEIVLDDITVNSKDTKGHFAIKYPELIPGEDIQVQAKAYSTTRFSNIVWSATALTNSLFADPYTYTPGNTVLGSAVDKGVAAVSSFRHLENLDARISSLGQNDSTFKITDAAQIADIDWTKFRTNVSENNVEPIASGVEVKDKCYVPVISQYFDKTAFALKYNGQNHSVANVKVDFAGDAGLFSTLTAGSTVKNLELIDFEITAREGTHNAGALVGSTTGTATDKVTVSNVLARNSGGTNGKDGNFNNNNTSSARPNVTAPGNAGGLIGSMTGGTVEKSAAALYVKSTGANGAAGGLIGNASGSTVSASYSGGHTYSDKPEGTNIEKYDTSGIYPVRYYYPNASASTDAEKNLPLYNVTATTNAGGLIGSASDVAIEYSYSTCSASANTAGGLVGSVNDGSIKNSYCTGLIPDQTDTIKTRGAFAGSLTGSPKFEACQYFEIVNEYREMKDGKLTSGYHYLEKLGNGIQNDEITAFDSSAAAYNGFSTEKGAWQSAFPYDNGGTDKTGLKAFYKVNGEIKYNFRTVAQLGATLNPETTDTTVYFVKDHYGDWPAPEEFIFN